MATTSVSQTKIPMFQHRSNWLLRFTLAQAFPIFFNSLQVTQASPRPNGWWDECRPRSPDLNGRWYHPRLLPIAIPKTWETNKEMTLRCIISICTVKYTYKSSYKSYLIIQHIQKSLRLLPITLETFLYLLLWPFCNLPPLPFWFRKPIR